MARSMELPTVEAEQSRDAERAAAEAAAHARRVVADRKKAWCGLLGVVRDEARDAKEDFLVYLVEVAIAHALSLDATAATSNRTHDDLSPPSWDPN